MIIEITIGVLFLAIWMIALFFEKTIGMSMILFSVPLTIFLIRILEKNNRIKNKKAKLLLIPIVLLSLTYGLFNNAFFRAINIIIIPCLIVIMIIGLFNEKSIVNTKLFGKTITGFFGPLGQFGNYFDRFILIVKEKFNIRKKTKGSGKIKKVIKAILITLPIVIVILALLSSADEVFSNIFNVVFDKIGDFFSKITIHAVVARILLTVLSFIYFASFFDYFVYEYKENEDIEKKDKKTNDNYTIKMILVALNVIYLLFCYIQIKSLFLKNVDINYANYARQGFFQLMIVSIINLVTILIAKKRENKDDVKTNKFINYMSLAMIVFTFIIVISAAVRMFFYESQYGYTLLRLLVYCTLFTESVLFIPTVFYILDKKIDLAKSYFIIIISIYVCMNYMNFDNLIAKRNVDRYIETGKIDMYYLEKNTGTDAVSQILRLIDTDARNEAKVKNDAGKYLKNMYYKLQREEKDFRNFNVSKLVAEKSILNSKSKILENENFVGDEVGIKIQTLEKVLDTKTNAQDINGLSGNLYYRIIDSNTAIRVINAGSILGQRSGIQVEKTRDGGKTWEKQTEDSVIIHNGAKIAFVNENVGFINDLGMAGTDGDDRFFLVTTDGGKTFVNSNIIHPDNIEEKHLLASETPYIEDGTLKVKIYTVNHSKTPIKTYYIFYSGDNGLNFKYLEKVE